MLGGSLVTADTTVLARATNTPFESTDVKPQAAITSGDDIPWALFAILALALVAAGAVAGWLITRPRSAAR